MMNNFFSPDQMDQMTKAATKQAEDAMSFGQAGFEAWMKSANTMMDGTTSLAKTLTSMTNKAREKQNAAMKQFMSCKTLNDMTETGTKVAQEALEDAMSGATELSEQAIKLCMESAEPLNEQMTKSMNTATKKAKAA